MLESVLTIDGTAYDASQRAAAGLSLGELVRTLEGGYDSLAFSESVQSPFPTYALAKAVSLTVDLGPGPITRFVGELVDVQTQQSGKGWTHGYTALGLKYLSDRVPVTAVDNTGTQVYNRTPSDPYYSASDAGLSIGEIIGRILTIPGVATGLNGYGIGDYTGLPSAPVLPTETTDGLDLLTVVPPSPVTLSSSHIFNFLDQLLSRYMPKFFLEIHPDTGRVLVKDTSDTAVFVPQTITLAGPDGPADPCTWPRVRRSIQNCATRLILRGGPEVEAAWLSLVDGTLAEVFTSTDKTNWDLTYFTSPKDAVAYGDVTATTSTSATLDPDDNAVFWSTNFWSTNNGVVTLYDTLATGINLAETRRVTSNNALTAGAGNTSTVNWDSTWPITGTSYDRFRIAGAAGGLIDTWRTYAPREPSSGDTGLLTYIGQHLVAYSAMEVRAGNANRSFGTHVPIGTVVGTGGASMPLGLEVVPAEGMFRFTQPTVTVFGRASVLNSGSPTTSADGLPTDVQIVALYSRGPLSVIVPADVGGLPQYEGTAYSVDGLELTMYLDYPDWIWKQDAASMLELAQQHLDSIKDAEVDVSFDWLDPDNLPSWDFLEFTWGVNFDINGASSPWSSLNAPARTIRVGFNQNGIASLSGAASTRRRPFSGDDLYTHPTFAPGSPLSELQGQGNWQQWNAMIASGNIPNAYQQNLNPAAMATGNAGMGLSNQGIADQLSPGSFTGMPDMGAIASAGAMLPADKVAAQDDTVEGRIARGQAQMQHQAELRQEGVKQAQAREAAKIERSRQDATPNLRTPEQRQAAEDKEARFSQYRRANREPERIQAQTEAAQNQREQKEQEARQQNEAAVNERQNERFQQRKAIEDRNDKKQLERWEGLSGFDGGGGGDPFAKFREGG